MELCRRVSVIVLTTVLTAGTIAGQESEKNQGRRKGARGGAIMGLTLGALSGDASAAAKGAVGGAVQGGVRGDWYDYDQSRRDDRTQMLADGISGSKQSVSGSQQSASGSQQSVSGSQQAVSGETVGAAGKRHFEDLKGEWTLAIWYMGREGKMLGASGTARGLSAGENGVRVLYQNVTGEDFDGAVNGQSILSLDPGQGFFLENSFSVSDDVVKAVGEFLADKNSYMFYVVGPTGGEMVSGGIMRSNVRIELRIVSPTLWIAEAFTLINSQETKVQTYRFTRP